MSGYGGRGADDGQGYGGQGYDEPAYGEQGYGEQGHGGRPRHSRQPRGYPGQGPGQPQPRGQGYGPPQGRDRDYGQQGGRQDPRAQGQRRPGTAPQYPRGSQQPMPGGGQRGPRRGADPGWQQEGGYDPRDAYPGDYQGRGDARFGQGAPGGPGAQGGQQGWGGDPGRDSGFLPGFGQGNEGYPGYDVDDRPRRGRRGRDDGRGGGGGGDDWGGDGGSGRRRSTIRRLAPWIALLVILTPLLVGGLYIYNIYENKYHPADYSGPGTGSVTVQVNSGDTAFSLGPKLQSLGVVASARAFELAAEQTTSTTTTTTGTGAAPGLEAGFYKLHMHMQASLAWAALLNTKNRVQLTVTVPEGKRASQVVLILAKATSIPASQFQAAINNPGQLGLPSYAKGKVEGYLFPATYTIQPNETAAQILKAMVARYNVEAQAINISAAQSRVGLSPEQVIIEASLAQAEGGAVSDYPKIARVIANRLKIGMHLQFDSTVLYGLGQYAVSATIAETRTPGPYNTYLNAGLPVGPICNPGDAAIQAILHPATGNWLYFLTKPGGKSEFSTTPLAGQ